MPNDGGATWTSYGKDFGKIKFMKNQALELHSPLPKSFKVSKEGTMEKRKTKDSSCSLLSHFWSTYQSPFSTCYIPFQSSGSQESNASNRVRFGAETRKIWPSEDNCSRLVRKFHTTPSNFAHPLAWCEFSPVFADSTRDLFFWIFLYKFPFFSL